MKNKIKIIEYIARNDPPITTQEYGLCSNTGFLHLVLNFGIGVLNSQTEWHRLSISNVGGLEPEIKRSIFRHQIDRFKKNKIFLYKPKILLRKTILNRMCYWKSRRLQVQPLPIRT